MLLFLLLQLKEDEAQEMKQIIWEEGRGYALKINCPHPSFQLHTWSILL